ncbi:hypothetical protein MUN88_17030 [Gracilibacillus caseinilyticus]|uniref:Tail assembly chaperone n=1 Tax=Gracilibacillus caseinilyticus TaxID=2932256 RepID=A0ABY4ETJ3_9BACI|nr:hypothetical protein [Gracilibacillus caseinilyticus]UOQ47736.1 hypothetical protein MUN88_17030 [Gracilibacillus caseinilyticus]
MANIKDLSLVTQEPLVLKFSEDEQFTIPADPKLDFTYKLLEFEEKSANAETSKEQFDLLIDMAVMILNQDESKDVTAEFVRKNIHQSQMKAIVQIYQNQMMENNNNPN